MAGMKKIGAFFLMTLQFYGAVYGQPLSFRHITEEDGLSQNSIYCIYQDREGFMWFGTQDGLNRYDGYNIITFRHDPEDSNSISHSWIWDIFEDRDRNLWIATWYGLNRYDPHTNQFKAYLPDSTNPGAILGDRPAAIREDADGNLWIGTWGGGLNKFIKKDDRFDHFLNIPGDDHSLPANYVRKLFLDRSGRFWVGTWNGLALMTKSDSSVRFIRYDCDDSSRAPPGGRRITSITEDEQGNIWAGTFGGGLLRIDPENARCTRYLYETSGNHAAGSNDISSVLIDDHHNVWAGTFSDGLIRLSVLSGRMDVYKNDPLNPAGIRANNVYSMLQDRSGLIWIGAGGLNILNQKNKRFNLLAENFNAEFKDITAFCEDDAGNLWMTSNQQGIVRYNLHTGKQHRFDHEASGAGNLNCNNVSDVIRDPDGNIWVGTRGGGLSVYSPLTRTFKHLPGNENTKYINALETDREGRIWMATYDRGLISYDARNRSYKTYISDPGNPKSLSGNYLLHLCTDSKDHLWIGVWGGGLCRFNRSDATFTRYVHDPENPGSLIDNIVHSIHEVQTDSADVLWIGTSNGLSYFLPDRKPAVFHHFTTKDGLYSNVIYGILDDSKGNLWLSGNNGLTQFNPRTKKARHFDKGDGLAGDEFNASACIKLENGMYLFGGIDGFNAFYPDSIQSSSFKPPIALTSFRVLNKEKCSAFQLPVLQDIVLPYKENFFSFEFSSLDFTEPAKNRYAYQLEGIDREWIDAGPRRFVSYTDIRPGNYLFKIKGTNHDGIWSNEIREINIVILPPYWQTWWFRLLVVIAFLALLYAFHRYRVNKLLELERLRVRIASDLHDDIGSALTRIAIHSEQIQASKKLENALRISKKIGALSRGVISTMSDIVWSIDARNDTWGNLIDRMKEVVHNTLLLKEIDARFDVKGVNESHKIPLRYRQNIFYIFKEAINNIVKHSDAGKVRIALLKAAHTFEMTISDNGTGIDFENIRYGNGLKNMKMRAESMKGTLEILNNNGVTIHLKITGNMN